VADIIQFFSEGKSMFRRSLSTPLIERLKPSTFWQNICQDGELWPEIRTDAITVYYRGGALLRELRLTNGDLVAFVQPKFIPLRQPAGKSIRVVDKGRDGLAFSEPLGPLPLATAEPPALRAYKAMMDQVLTTFPEAEIIQSICCRAENQILDQEIAFQESGESRDKIDLCHFDTALQKMVFVEVKRKDDGRLLQPEERPEILDQLAAYCRRLRDYRSDLLAAYRLVVGWKRELGLGSRLSQVPTDAPTDVLDKPVLVIGNCTSTDVQRIKNGEGEWAPLMAGLKDVAEGLIMCGTSGCRLNLAKGTQTISYLS